jgi:hypothetical protein
MFSEIMKKHLRILYGCDDRFEITKKTVELCQGHFDTITILNSGPIEFFEKLRNNLSANVIQFNKFIELESARRALFCNIPINDWVLWLDADERPSKELLENIDNIITIAENGGKNSIAMIWQEHCDGRVCHVTKPLPTLDDLRDTSGPYFMAPKLVKIEGDLFFNTNFGSHEICRNVSERILRVPYIVHHFKSHVQYCQSILYSGYFNPFVHVNISNINILKTCINLPEFIKLRELQKKYNVYTSNDLVKKIKIEKNKDFIDEIKQLFLTFPGIDDYNNQSSSYVFVSNKEHYISFVQMHRLAHLYDLSLDTPNYECTEECCLP